MSLPVRTESLLAGWGNYPTGSADLLRPELYGQLNRLPPHSLPRGLGRSYGDASLNTGSRVVLMERLNRMLSFDEKRGVLRAEGGTSLADIVEVFVPRGWFLPVTPGTQFATLGGCIACDVHGKNHHQSGTIGAYLKEIELILPGNSTRRCSPEKESDLFWATVGGMGLTGIISEAVLQLIPIPSPYMVVRHHATAHLEETLQALQNSKWDDRYSVAWIDCLASKNRLGRSIVMTAHHAEKDELQGEGAPSKKVKKRLPVFLPSWVLNPLTIKLFNSIYYYWQGGKKKPFLLDYESYFYPLDAIPHWNRLYGKRGFVQYQCVLPFSTGEDGLKEVLERLSSSLRPSFLAVLKRFGKEGKGFLSFPREGWTLALDLPVSDGLFPFLDDLDQIVLKHEGRLYLAKDSRMAPETFRAMYPRFNEWKIIKEKVDPNWELSSDLSRRLQWELS